MIKEIAVLFEQENLNHYPVDYQLNRYLQEHPDHSVKCMTYDKYSRLLVVFQYKENSDE